MPHFRKSKRKNLLPTTSVAKSSTSLAVIIGTWSALVITVSTLLLTLLSYGHDLGYLLTAGLQPEDLQRSPIDLLSRSWHPILDTMRLTNKMLSLETLYKLWEKVLWNTSWLISLAFFSALCAYCYRYKTADLVRVKLVESHAKLSTRWAWLSSVNRFFKSNFSAQRLRMFFNSNRLWGFSGWLAFPIVVILTTMLLAIINFVILSGIMVVIIVPFSSFDSGIARAQQELLNPIGCINPKIKNGDDPEHRARCVRVMREGQELARGYLIDYGAGRIFLYQPCTKQPLSLSIERTVIEQIDTLDSSNPSYNCRVVANKP
jgi:hypothetical protein